MESADEIIGNLETLTISVIENDPEGEEQYEIVRLFLQNEGIEKPSDGISTTWKSVLKKKGGQLLPGRVATRVLHSPEGSRDYKRKPTIPEIGICLDLLTHLAIDRYGNISMCVRFDPEGHLRIGHVNTGIYEAWTSPKRRKYIEYHIAGRRCDLPGCRSCDYWGVPTGPDDHTLCSPVAHPGQIPKCD